MKRSSIELLRELVIIQMNHCFYSAAAMLALALFGSSSPFLGLCMLLGALPVYELWVRRRAKRLFVFLLLSMLPPVLFFLLPVQGNAQKLLPVLFGLLYAVISVYLRIKTDTDETQAISPIFAAGTLGGLLIVMKNYVRQEWEACFLLCGLIFFALYLIQYYLTQYLRFLTVNESSAANIPERAIFTTGLRQTAMFTAAATLLVAAAANIGWLAFALSALKKALTAFIRRYLQLTPGQTESFYDTGESAQAGGMELLPEAGEPSLFWVILEYIAIAGVLLLLSGLLLYGLFCGYRALRRGFFGERRKKEKELLAEEDVHEQVALAKKEGLRKRKAGGPSMFSPAERIRRSYRRRVEGERFLLVGDGERSQLRYLTAKQCCDKINAPELLEAYEKARYSQSVCTNEDYRRARK